MVKVSVIIPIYNSEYCIGRALDSVLYQSLHEIEIICVNDGSIDRSLDVVMSYQKKDSRIVILDQPNMGAAVSRNNGLDVAKGEYVAFLDSDDEYIDKDALEKIYVAGINNNANVCLGGMFYESDGDIKEINIIAKIIRQNSIANYSQYQSDFYFTAFIYKRDYLNNYSIRFPDKRVYEDPCFLSYVFNHENLITCVDTKLYLYHYMKKKHLPTISMTMEMLDGIDEVLSFSEDHEYYALKNEILSQLNRTYYHWLCANIDNTDVYNKLLQICANYYGNNRENILILKNLHDFGMCKELYAAKYVNQFKSICEKGKKIILFGAGDWGKQWIELNNITKFYNLVGIVDSNKQGQYLGQYRIYGKEFILCNEYDYVVITINSDEAFNEICELLYEENISKTKILRANFS